MPRIEVEPGQLHSASGRQAALADQVAGLAGRLDGIGADAAGAAGEHVAAAAMADCSARGRGRCRRSRSPSAASPRT
jgi:hypothetical protein